jgi:thiol-disulfide isomerase/thioredoxin
MLLGMRALVTCVFVLCVRALAPASAAPAPVVSAPVSAPATWLGAQFGKTAARIQKVIPAGPAARGGLRAGDVILSVGSAMIKQAADVTSAVSTHKAGDRVDVVVQRGDAKITASVTIAVRPTPADVQRAQLVGKRAPEVDLSTLDGTSVKLSALRGKVVVLDFWATWCVPCVQALPTLNAWQRDLGPKGLVVIGVTQDQTDEVRALIADGSAIDYPVALDAAQDATRSYRVQGLPMTVVIDKTGVVRFAELGNIDLEKLQRSIVSLMK